MKIDAIEIATGIDGRLVLRGAELAYPIEVFKAQPDGISQYVALVA